MRKYLLNQKFERAVREPLDVLRMNESEITNNSQIKVCMPILIIINFLLLLSAILS